MNILGTRARLWLGILGATVALSGCSSDDGDAGAAPTIADLALTPTEVEVGKTNALSGSVTIDDPDGDVAQVGVDATLPDGTKQSPEDRCAGSERNEAGTTSPRARSGSSGRGRLPAGLLRRRLEGSRVEPSSRDDHREVAVAQSSARTSTNLLHRALSVISL